MLRLALLIHALVLCAATPALSSSGDAWEEFAAAVREKCLAASADMLEQPAIAVDPFGSQGYGLAVLSGKPRGGDGTVSYLCVMDKQSREVELGSELGADVMGVTIPK